MTASALFRQHNLWEEVTSLLAYHTSYMVYRDDLVLQQRTYSVIRNHLLEMMLLTEETRQRVSILEYIQDRTHLSRSSILNVLSALKRRLYCLCPRRLFAKYRLASGKILTRARHHLFVVIHLTVENV